MTDPIDGDELLTPREVAGLLGIRVETLARWARAGRLSTVLTPGGFRRYRMPDVRALIKAQRDPERERMTQDAVRLYDQGWSIRQVAAKFDCGYSVMHRILRKHTALRPPYGGT